MVDLSFRFSRCPRIFFGDAYSGRLGEIAGGIGRRALLLTGRRSLEASGYLEALAEQLRASGVEHSIVGLHGEPSPESVDEIASSFRDGGIDVVLAVGGGSVLDAGKAVSAMLAEKGSVCDYLEGIGDPDALSGAKVPFVAVPTTAGTGSEATKNAVLSREGPSGFKKSLRHDNFVPDVAVVAPVLTRSCTPGQSGASGMDAFTQLLESYVSTGAGPLTDALAVSGIAAVRDNLLAACAPFESQRGRAGMSYAALVSGMTLANAGLGVVHGLASELGWMHRVPHGVACGTLLGSATRANLAHLASEGGEGAREALGRYAVAGAILSGSDPADIRGCVAALLDTIDRWTEALGLPLLREYGIVGSGLDAIVAETGQRSNPVALSGEELRGILSRRL